MNKKINKFWKILLILFLLIIMSGSTVYAAPSRPEGGNGGKTGADDLFANVTAQDEAWSSMRSNGMFGNFVDKPLDVVLSVAQVFWFVALIVAIIKVLMLGFKFVTEPAERAEAKKALLPVLIVVIILVGAFPIWKFIVLLFGE